MTTHSSRKDRIIVDNSLIGREIFFRGKVKANYITPNKKYTITKTDNDTVDGVYFIGDSGDTVYVLINIVSCHIDYKLWLLAKCTSSEQSVVRTESGRKL